MKNYEYAEYSATFIKFTKKDFSAEKNAKRLAEKKKAQQRKQARATKHRYDI